MDGLRTWLVAWLGPKRIKPPAPALPRATRWSEDQRRELFRFLESPTGKLLIERLRATEAANAIAGAKDVLHTAHSAGRSMGYGECLAHLLSLSSTADAKAVKIDIDTAGEPRADETTDEAEAREIEQLLHRISP